METGTLLLIGGIMVTALLTVINLLGMFILRMIWNRIDRLEEKQDEHESKIYKAISCIQTDLAALKGRLFSESD